MSNARQGGPRWRPVTDDAPTEVELRTCSMLVAELQKAHAGTVEVCARDAAGRLTHLITVIEMPGPIHVAYIVREDMKDKALNGSRVWLTTAGGDTDA